MFATSQETCSRCDWAGFHTRQTMRTQTTNGTFFGQITTFRSINFTAWSLIRGLITSLACTLWRAKTILRWTWRACKTVSQKTTNSFPRRGSCQYRNRMDCLMLRMPTWTCSPMPLRLRICSWVTPTISTLAGRSLTLQVFSTTLSMKETRLKCRQLRPLLTWTRRFSSFLIFLKHAGILLTSKSRFSSRSNRSSRRSH